MIARDRFETAIEVAMVNATEQPMRWGVDDCALWVANIERDVLGFDPARSYRRRYKTRIGAMRIMTKMHRGGLLGQLRSVAKSRGRKRIHSELAQIGDVGLAWTEHEGKQVLATVVCRKRGWFVGRADAGVTFVQADRVAIAWSVLDDALQPYGRSHLPQMGLRRPMVSTEAVVREPVSTFIGLTALISGLGASAAVAGAVGGFLITTAASHGVSHIRSVLT